jgi:plasmid stabilization system protein ParE
MKYYFHEAAEAEFVMAVDYYEDCRPGLGLEFAREVHATIARAIRFPDAWSTMSKRTRRCLVNRFPFGVIYQVKSDALRIVAVANLRRRPDYWKDRL